MEIHNMIPLRDPGGRALAVFSCKPTPDMRLCGLRLSRRRDGRYRVIPPQAFGAAAMHFAPALFEQISDAAGAAFERLHASAHDRN